MQEAVSLSVSVRRPWREVYEGFWRPQAFPTWASGLSRSPLEPDGDGWSADGPEGRVRIRFTPHNAFGVMDHHVEAGDGAEVFIPLRVLANGEGAEVVLTLFRQPGMDDAKFAADQDWVRRDLAALKALAERDG